jgi:hypothetical protein
LTNVSNKYNQNDIENKHDTENDILPDENYIKFQKSKQSTKKEKPNVEHELSDKVTKEVESINLVENKLNIINNQNIDSTIEIIEQNNSDDDTLEYDKEEIEIEFNDNEETINTIKNKTNNYIINKEIKDIDSSIKESNSNFKLINKETVESLKNDTVIINTLDTQKYNLIIH